MHAYDQVWKSITGDPGESFAGKRYTFATLNKDHKAVTPAAGKLSLGVAYESNEIGQPMQIVASGFAFIKLGAALEAGQEVEVGEGGKAVALTTGKSAGYLVVGGPADAIGTVYLG